MSKSTRAEREQEARELRDQGLLQREIGLRMNVSTSTVNEYLNDPGGLKLKARKQSYAGVCVSCGGPTNGYAGKGKAHRQCMDCICWPQEAVVDAMGRWAEEHGCAPRTIDWQQSAIDHPCSAQVCKRFGWNRMLLLAGLSLVCDRRPETQEWVEKELRAGRPVVEIAAELDVTPSAIYMRMEARGLRVSELRP